MRISTNYIYDNSIRIMQRSVSNLLDAQEVMASQSKINRLSDDPVGAGQIVSLEDSLSQYDNFLNNLGAASDMATLYDDAMTSVTELLKRTKELVLQEANTASSTETTREAARTEIASMASQLVTVANLQYSNRYLFAGYSDNAPAFLDTYVTTTPGASNSGAVGVASQHINDVTLVTGDTYTITFTGAATYDVVDTTTGVVVSSGSAYTSGSDITFDGITVTLEDTPGPPVAGDTFTIATTPAGSTYQGDTGQISYEVDQDRYETINLTGDYVFQGVGVSDGQDLFSLYDRAVAALNTNDTTELNALLDDFDQAMTQISNVQAVVGSKENLYDNLTSRLEDIQVNLKEQLSDVRDVDVTEAVTELSIRETAYEAVLNATSAVIQPTLFDYL
jgi:flagellar hook-associated protein 3 FlgL